MNLRFFHFFEYALYQFWDDIDEINSFLDMISQLTGKEFKAKYGYGSSLKFKTKTHSYTIDFTLTGDLVDFKNISRK
ncbi:hypothetical protein P3G55_24295 [Leptospira sp. 96542]|nr:hypothetical protein [Leptospira sp. 96542]